MRDGAVQTGGSCGKGYFHFTSTEYQSDGVVEKKVIPI
jgi:hypothetical protein